MTPGTKTVLFGFHCCLIHPFFVAAAWWRLYGIPLDPRLWAAFFVHDIGYLGKINIDGIEGERHPELGAKLMRVFGQDWSSFCLYHSRAYAQRDHQPPSQLCKADKLAIVLTPAWLMHIQMWCSGELAEALRNANNPTNKFYNPNGVTTFAEFHTDMCAKLNKWVLKEEAKPANIKS